MKRFLLYLLLLLSFKSLAQVPVTLNSAIDTALKSNFDIRIARINTKINTINNTYGVAGGLPTLNGTGTATNSWYNLKQKTSSGIDITKNGVNSNSYNAGLSAGIILFNGFRIIATKGQLSHLQQQSELELNMQIQNTMAAIMVMYYDILRQQNYLGIIKSTLEVSAKKFDIIKERSAVGMANEADILQAQMDVNSDEQTFKGQEVIIEQDKTNLQQLMGVKQYVPITIHDSIVVDESIGRDSVISFLKNNPQYLSADQQIKINEQIVKEVKSLRYPSIRLNAGYNFIYSSSSAGFNLFTQNYGPTVGATMQVPIFNGTIYKKQQVVASYNVENAKLQRESLLSILTADAIKAYQAYESSIQQMKSQKKSYENAGRLVKIVVQRFSLNQATILDVKAAQESFESAGYMYINLQYSAKAAEIELKRLIFRLGL